MKPRIIYCGGREYSNGIAVLNMIEMMESIYGDHEIVHGDAKGADRLAGYCGTLAKMQVLPVPADWDTLGKRAGTVRNRAMLDLPGVVAVCAFPGGVGTAHMTGIAQLRKGVQVFEYRGDVILALDLPTHAGYVVNIEIWNGETPWPTSTKQRQPSSAMI